MMAPFIVPCTSKYASVSKEWTFVYNCSRSLGKSRGCDRALKVALLLVVERSGGALKRAVGLLRQSLRQSFGRSCRQERRPHCLWNCCLTPLQPGPEIVFPRAGVAARLLRLHRNPPHEHRPCPNRAKGTVGLPPPAKRLCFAGSNCIKMRERICVHICVYVCFEREIAMCKQIYTNVSDICEEDSNRFSRKSWSRQAWHTEQKNRPARGSEPTFDDSSRHP